MVTREQIRLRLRGYSFGGMPRRPLFFKPTESVCLCVCLCVRSWGWQLFCNLHAGCPAHFLNWFRVGCLHHQRVECESVVPPPGGAPPAQGNTRLCSYPSVLPPSVVPFGCAALSLPLRVGCMYHQRVECESVVPPPGGAPPAQGNTHLCSYPSVLPSSVVPFGCAAFSLPRLVSLPLRVGCMYHQRVECESVVPPPGGAPPAQGSTHLCSYPSVLPPSACVTWLCRDGRYKVS